MERSSSRSTSTAFPRERTATPGAGRISSAITNCDVETGALEFGPTTAADTGSNRTCTAAGESNPEYPLRDGCLFGPPLPIPNPGTPSTSTCVVNRVTTSATGSGNCNDGSVDLLDLPLGSDIYLTGDLLPDREGVQPCPLCLDGVCRGGPNDGLECTPGSGPIGDAYPTSHDCPPPDNDQPQGGGEGKFIGTLPIPFQLTTGTSSKVSADLADQARVFCGFCAQPFTTNFQGPPAVACTSNADSVGDLPSPGAVSLPGVSQLLP